MNALTSVQDLIHYLTISRPMLVVTDGPLLAKMEEAVSRVKDVNPLIMDIDELFADMVTLINQDLELMGYRLTI